MRVCLAAALLAVSALLVTLPAAGERFVVDGERSTIRFAVPYDFMIVGLVEGEFREFSGWADFDRADLSRSKVEIEIATASLTTELAARDLGLRGDLFFAAESHPRIVFKGVRVEAGGSGNHLVGSLQLRGVTRPARVPFELLDFGDTLVVLGRTRLNRLDFGVEGPLPSPDFAIGDTVSVQVNLTLTRAAAID